jgi:thiosulfate dehydrogenase
MGNRNPERRIKMRRRKLQILTIMGITAGLFMLFALKTEIVSAHKAKHTAEQLKVFEQLFMEQVRIGDLLFHGDPATEKKMGTTLSNTGMACAMCHPFASDTHPYEFPKFQEQMNEFGTLRDMINWCIEKPNEGVKLDPNSPAMKSLEAYIYWSNRNSKLDPGRH